LTASFYYIQIHNKNSNTLEREVRKGNVTVRCRVRIRLTTNESVGRLNAVQETATDCGYVGLQAIMSVELFANKYIALNHEWKITGNYTVRMHKTLKH